MSLHFSSQEVQFWRSESNRCFNSMKSKNSPRGYVFVVPCRRQISKISMIGIQRAFIFVPHVRDSLVEFRETNIEERSFSWKETRRVEEGRGHCVLAQFVEFTAVMTINIQVAVYPEKCPVSSEKPSHLSVCPSQRFFVVIFHLFSLLIPRFHFFALNFCSLDVSSRERSKLWTVPKRCGPC